MKYDYKLQCPRCSDIFVVKVDTTIQKNFCVASCPKCAKKIKVKVLKDALVPCEIKKPSATGDKNRRSGPGIKQRSSKPDAHEVLPILDYHFSQSPQPGRLGSLRPPVRPAPDHFRQSRVKEEKQNSIAKILSKPDKRLKLAQVLLILVFIFGIVNGITTIVYSTNDPIKVESGGSGPVDIQGKIINFHDGTPIKGCRVSIKETGQWTVTDSDGWFFFSNVEVGNYQFEAYIDGYIKVVKKVTVDPELLGMINFELEQGVGLRTIDESVVTGIDNDNSNSYIFPVLIMVFASLALLSMFLIRQRNFYQICLLSSFFSIFSFGVAIGAVLGIIAFILILLSKSSFSAQDGGYDRDNSSTR